MTNVRMVTMLDGTRRKLNLTGARRITIGQLEWKPGQHLMHVWIQPRARRCILHTYCHWDNGQGRVVGARVTEADNKTIAELVERFPACAEMAAWLPER